MRQKGTSPILILVIILIIGAIGFIVYKMVDNQPMILFPISSSPPSSTSPHPTDLEVNIDPGRTILGTVVLEGTVPAGWMFEGSFPITILDQEGNVITQSFGQQIEGENWMSGNPVKFIANISFETEAQSGFIRLSKDNPSGLPENDEHYDIPVKINTGATVPNL